MSADALPPESNRKKLRLFRWKAVVPLGGLLVLGALVWWFMLDTIVERTVEVVGTSLVGAKVELESADVRFREGHLTLRGLQVTNPDAPMTNLIEAEEIVADLRLFPLLEKKVFIDTMALRGMRFNTPRETSGAVDRPSETSGAIRAQLNSWADQVRIPPFSLAGLGQAVDFSGLNPDRLETPAAVRALTLRVDSSATAWEARIRAADPTAVLAQGRALVDSLEGASVQRLGVQGAVRAAGNVRQTIARVDEARGRIAALDDSARASFAAMTGELRSLDAFRTRDLQYAMGLLRLPSLGAPDLSPSLLGDFAVSRIRRLLYWIEVAGEYLPPGLDPRRRAGPSRARMAGTTVLFPSPADYPAFTLAHGEVSFEIDAGGGAGEYAGLLQNLTSAPAALGLPLSLSASRLGRGGPDVSIGVSMDHVGRVRDSISARVTGVRLPNLPVAGLGTTLDLGTGTTDLLLNRVGDSVTGRWLWQSQNVQWIPDGGGGGGPAAAIRDVLSSVSNVELELRFSGSIRGPRIAVRSNIGSVVATAVRARLQTEIAAAETRVRAEIDRHVAGPVEAYRNRVEEAEGEIRRRVGTHRDALNQLKADLELRLRNLTRGLPPGIGAP